MKLLLTFLIPLMLIQNLANGNIWRVNANPNVSADFSTLASAISGISAGDTLYVEPGSYDEPGNYLVIDKKVTIIGTGFSSGGTQYSSVENDSTMFLNEEANIKDVVDIQSTGTGTNIIGVRMLALEIHGDSILIWRNKIANSTYSSVVSIQGTVSTNIRISGNYIYNIPGTPQKALFVSTNDSDIMINNNIIIGAQNLSIHISSNTSDVSIVNNVLYGDLTAENTLLLNNILISGDFYPNPFDQNVFYYNISHNNSFGTENGNQSNIPPGDIFTLIGSFDSRYRLKDYSGNCPPTCNPAKGTGINGSDLGIFGGNDPYVLSGMPPIPAIYHANIVLDSTATKLNVDIDAKSHK